MKIEMEMIYILIDPGRNADETLMLTEQMYFLLPGYKKVLYKQLN